MHPTSSSVPPDLRAGDPSRAPRHRSEHGWILLHQQRGCASEATPAASRQRRDHSVDQSWHSRRGLPLRQWHGLHLLRGTAPTPTRMRKCWRFAPYNCIESSARTSS
eukprot:6356845-Pyramimonas_sp.AAC.1